MPDFKPPPSKYRQLGRVIAIVDERAYCMFPVLGYDIAVAVPTTMLGPQVSVGFFFMCEMVAAFDFHFESLELSDLELDLDQRVPTWEELFRVGES
jgi:hypothetical protein